MRYNPELQPQLDHALTVTAMRLNVGDTTVELAPVREPRAPRRPRRRMSRWHWLWLAPALIAAPLAGMLVTALADVLMHGGVA